MRREGVHVGTRCTATATMKGLIRFAESPDPCPPSQRVQHSFCVWAMCRQTAPPDSFVRCSRHVLLRCVKAADRYGELAKLCYGMHRMKGQHFKGITCICETKQYRWLTASFVSYQMNQTFSRLPYEGRIGIGLPRAANALR